MLRTGFVTMTTRAHKSRYHFVLKQASNVFCCPLLHIVLICLIFFLPSCWCTSPEVLNGFILKAYRVTELMWWGGASFFTAFPVTLDSWQRSPWFAGRDTTRPCHPELKFSSIHFPSGDRNLWLCFSTTRHQPSFPPLLTMKPRFVKLPSQATNESREQPLVYSTISYSISFPRDACR